LVFLLLHFELLLLNLCLLVGCISLLNTFAALIREFRLLFLLNFRWLAFVFHQLRFLFPLLAGFSCCLLFGELLSLSFLLLDLSLLNCLLVLSEVLGVICLEFLLQSGIPSHHVQLICLSLLLVLVDHVVALCFLLLDLAMSLGFFLLPSSFFEGFPPGDPCTSAIFVVSLAVTFHDFSMSECILFMLVIMCDPAVGTSLNMPPMVKMMS